MPRNFIVQRNIVSLLVLALLAACASSSPRINNVAEAVHYQALATNNYTPPGPAYDPWGPYIVEASARFDVPQRWIRQVMKMESGGNEYLNGQLTTSYTGAMGLMQVEPETYDELRAEYNLGDDPYDQHDNILAGTAYLRQLYDQFGTPGFLAAYHAGPGRFSNYLAGRTDLPDVTRQYVAALAPSIEEEEPLNRSPNDQLAYNMTPVLIPAGRRRNSGSSTLMLASNDAYSPPEPRYEPVETAYLAPPVPPEPPRYIPASAQHRSHGFSLVASAYADTLSERDIAGGPASWEIQVGAYSNRQLARAATMAAKQEEPSRLAHASTRISALIRDERRLYRARLAGLTRSQAESACERLGRIHTSCMVVSPDSAT